MPIFDISNWFAWKTKAEREQEAEDYAEWAFPFGEGQQDMIKSLLATLVAENDASLAMVQFLSCRELYEKALKDTKRREAAIEMMMSRTKKYKLIIKEKDMGMYLSLVLANASVDETLEYPSPEQIRAYADELNLLRPAK